MGAGSLRVASRRLIPDEAKEVLDLCAAPGGKTMQLGAAGHQVTSVDASQNRLARLRENLVRTHLRAQLVPADATTWVPGREFDAILLDAPCSATGTFRRHPEVLYRARPRVIARTGTWRPHMDLMPQRKGSQGGEGSNACDAGRK